MMMKHLRYNMPFPFKPMLHSIYGERCCIGFHNGKIPYASAFVRVEDSIIKIQMRYRTALVPDYQNLHKNGTLYPDGLFREFQVELANSSQIETGDFRTTIAILATDIKEWLADLPRITRIHDLQPCGLPYLPIIDGFAKMKTFVFGAGWDRFGPWTFDWSKPIVFENCRLWSEGRFSVPKEEVLKQQHGYSILHYLAGRTVSINGILCTVKQAHTDCMGTMIEVT